MLNLFRKKKKQTLLVKKGAISAADISKLEANGHIVILTDGKPDDIVPLDTGADQIEGDGKAVFLDAGTEAEFNDLKKEDDGTLPWYKRLDKLS